MAWPKKKNTFASQKYVRFCQKSFTKFIFLREGQFLLTLCALWSEMNYGTHRKKSEFFNISIFMEAESKHWRSHIRQDLEDKTEWWS